MINCHTAILQFDIVHLARLDQSTNPCSLLPLSLASLFGRYLSILSEQLSIVSGRELLELDQEVAQI